MQRELLQDVELLQDLELLQGLELASTDVELLQDIVFLQDVEHLQDVYCIFKFELAFLNACSATVSNKKYTSTGWGI